MNCDNVGQSHVFRLQFNTLCVSDIAHVSSFGTDIYIYMRILIGKLLAFSVISLYSIDSTCTFSCFGPVHVSLSSRT